MVQTDTLDLGFLFEQLMQAARDSEDELAAIIVEAAAEIFQTDGRAVVDGLGLRKRGGLFLGEIFGSSGIDLRKTTFNFFCGQVVFHAIHLLSI